MTYPLTVNETLTRAGRAIGKVERFGQRGLSLINHEEVEALVVLAAASGVQPLKRDEQILDPRRIETQTQNGER